MTEPYHIPALLNETILGLNIQPDGIYVDATFGGGGHSRAILAHLGEKGRLFSFDQDWEAYENARTAEEKTNRITEDKRWQFVHGNFRYLHNFLDYYGIDQVDGILADIGVSFHHFDTADRGFSFRFEGPLDMRMNRQGGKTAADIVNTYSEDDLARVLYLYGELHNSRQLARKLVSMRPVTRTEQLATVTQDKKVLTCLFQALRIEVNDELGALSEMLLAARDLLKPQGRLAILTYHSLEDRLVKNFLRSGNLEGNIEKDFYGNTLTPFTLIEKGKTADQEEVARNPRSRSAKLRVAAKI